MSTKKKPTNKKTNIQKNQKVNGKNNDIKKSILIYGLLALTLIICIGLLVVANKTPKDGGAGPEISEELIIENADESNLQITLNGIPYYFPWRNSTFLRNGWVATDRENEDLLNSKAGKMGGYDVVSLKQGDLLLYTYSKPENNELIKNSRVDGFWIDPAVEGADGLDFYGIGFGSSKEEVEKIVPPKNYSISEDSKGITYYSFSMSAGGGIDVSIELSIDKNNKLSRIQIFRQFDY
ncbi:MAG: hypothetical protein Q4B34_02145 [Candidatus Saccharibacteria bacterium]|nr:hypothetical protein [Candidatus Saccharibacteria bacterium]